MASALQSRYTEAIGAYGPDISYPFALEQLLSSASLLSNVREAIRERQHFKQKCVTTLSVAQRKQNREVSSRKCGLNLMNEWGISQAKISVGTRVSLQYNCYRKILRSIRSIYLIDLLAHFVAYSLWHFCLMLFISHKHDFLLLALRNVSASAMLQ